MVSDIVDMDKYVGNLMGWTLRGGKTKDLANDDALKALRCVLSFQLQHRVGSLIVAIDEKRFEDACGTIDATVGCVFLAPVATVQLFGRLESAQAEDPGPPFPLNFGGSPQCVETH